MPTTPLFDENHPDPRTIVHDKGTQLKKQASMPHVDTGIPDRCRNIHTGSADRQMIKGLHHSAYRCRDSEETRHFYEDFLGLSLINAFEITETLTGRRTSVLHSFYAMGDGSCLAFFEAPDRVFEFKHQHDFDLHIALEVDSEILHNMFEKGKAEGIETRGISDHGFCHSIYFRDPNGYVIELAAPVTAQAPAPEGEVRRAARLALEHWQAGKSG